MKCNYCGTDYEGKFCSNCGASSVNTDAAQQVNNVQPMENYNQVPNQQMEKAKKPIYKKWWFWVIAVIIVFAIIANLGGGGDKSPTKETSSNTSNVSAASSAKDETFGLNDTAVFKSIKVTANKLQESDGVDFFKPEQGNKFIGVQFTIENISDKDQVISSLVLFDAYVDGVKCDYSMDANLAFKDDTLDGTISAGKKMVGYYSVEVPADWSELELQVKSSWISNSKASFIFNK